MLDVLAFRCLTYVEVREFYRDDRELCSCLAIKAYGNLNRPATLSGYVGDAFHRIVHRPYIQDKFPLDMAEFGMLECLEHVEHIENWQEDLQMYAAIAASGNVSLTRRFAAITNLPTQSDLAWTCSTYYAVSLSSTVWTDSAEIIKICLDAVPSNKLNNTAIAMMFNAITIGNLHIAHAILEMRYIAPWKLSQTMHMGMYVPREFVKQYEALYSTKERLTFPESLLTY